MKRLVMTALSIVIVGVVALPTGAAETSLSVTLQLPLKSHLGQNLTLFKNEVEKSSDGAIDVQVYDSAQLYRDKEVPQAVGSRQIEMGVASLTRFVGEIPAVDIFYLPFVFNKEKLVRAATKKGGPVRGPLDAAILKTGNRVLWWQADGSTVFLSKNGPIKTPVDINGKYQIAPDLHSASRSDSRRIAGLCNCYRDTEDGWKDKRDGIFFSRNRPNPTAGNRSGRGWSRNRAVQRNGGLGSAVYAEPNP